MLAASILLLLGSSGLGFLNKSKLADKQAKIESAEAAKTSAQSEASKAKDAEKKAKTAQTEAESKANDLQTQVTTAATEAASLKAQIDTANESIKAKQTDIDALNQKLAAATPPPAMAPAPGVNDELTKAKTQLAELQIIKDGLESQLKSALSQTQSLSQQIARRDTAEAKNGLTGRVLAVDRNWNFVVLNLGGRSGINANETMVIRRGNSLVGRVRITSVEPSQSIADIVPNSVPAGISVQAGRHRDLFGRKLENRNVRDEKIVLVSGGRGQPPRGVDRPGGRGSSRSVVGMQDRRRHPGGPDGDVEQGRPRERRSLEQAAGLGEPRPARTTRQRPAHRRGAVGRVAGEGRQGDSALKEEAFASTFLPRR